MDRKYFIFAMSRSGHHAVINWIMENHNGTSKHFNNCIRGWENGKLLPLTRKQSAIIRKGPELILRNFENFDLQYYDIIPHREKHDVIFINRDPYNWIASSMKAGGHFAVNWIDKMGNKMDTRINIYKSYLKESKNITNITKTKLDINYNVWFTSDDYRRSLAKKLGLQTHNKGLDKISQWGGGSSFDKTAKNAQDLDPLNRWINYKNNKQFWALFDDELEEIGNTYFNMPCPKLIYETKIFEV